FHRRSCRCCSRPPTTQTYTLSLHDALPISRDIAAGPERQRRLQGRDALAHEEIEVIQRAGLHAYEHLVRLGLRIGDVFVAQNHQDRKSTRLNSSHSQISYAVLCLIKTKNRA